MIRTSSAIALGAIVRAARNREAAAVDLELSHARRLALQPLALPASFHLHLDGANGDFEESATIDDGTPGSRNAFNRLSR